LQEEKKVKVWDTAETEADGDWTHVGWFWEALEHCEDGDAISGGLQIINSDSFHVLTIKYIMLKMRW